MIKNQKPKNPCLPAGREYQKVIFIFFFAVLYSLLPVLPAGRSISAFAQDEIIPAIKFKEADIKIVLQSIAEKAVKDGRKVNIVSSPSVKGLVDVNLESVDWQTALKVILKAYDYGYEWVGDNIILVATLEELAEKRKKEVLAREIEPLETKTFILSFAKVAELKPTINKLLTDRGTITIDKRANAMVITDTQTGMEMIERSIEDLDMITPQVVIEAKIVETDLTKGENLGIRWDIKLSGSGAKRPTTFPWTSHLKGTGTKIFPKVQSPDELERVTSTIYNDAGEAIGTSQEEKVWNKLVPGFPQVSKGEFAFGTLDFSQFQVLLEILSHRSGTEIISNPRITTLDNNAASIKVATEWPIPKYSYNSDTGSWEITNFEFKPIGVTLKVTPHINKEGYITMDITPEVSEIAGEVSFGSGATLPLVYSQATATKVMIKDGETLVVGGLIKDKKQDSIQKVPILGDIPFLGNLFKYTSRSNEKKDLLIFISPKIIKPRVND